MIKLQKNQEAKSYRLNAQHLFLTYSRCPLDRDFALKQLVIKTKHFLSADIDNYCVAQELHQDGGKHLHMYLQMSKKINTVSAHKIFNLDDELGNTYSGNYQGCRDRERVLNYCVKCDKNILSNFNVPEYLESMVNHTKRNKNRREYENLMELGPHKLVKTGDIHYSKLKAAMEAQALMNQYEEMMEEAKKEDLPSRLETNWPNITFNIDLDLKQCHLWIYSSGSNKGKTTFLLSLMKKYRCYWYNIGENFQESIHPQTEVILFDEFKGGVPITTLNLICDGTYKFPQKGKAPILLRQKPLVIVCSNFSISETYQNSKVDNLQSRFQEISLDMISSF